jgi:hypothetical protein
MDEPKEDEAEELPPFRWNWQALFMVGFTLVALAIPLLGVVWSLRAPGARPVPTPPAEQRVAAENPGLRAALEKASDTLAVAPLADTRPALEIPAATDAERAQKVQKLKALVAGQGGSVVEVETGRRFLVTGPATTFGAVSTALLPGKPAPTTNDAAGLFEVRFP